MLPAAVALLIGGVLARLGVWPLQMWLLDRRVTNLDRRASQLARDIRQTDLS